MKNLGNSDSENEIEKITKWALATYNREELAEMYARMAVAAGDSAVRTLQLGELRDANNEINRLGKKIVTLKAKIAADARHSQPGGSRDKKDAIRTAWASGKFASRDRCAEEECAFLKMSLSAARRALRNTPEPPSRCTA